jgi:endonuclease/exonuclease/phosphatase family metal-dependent hydrolase
MSSKKIFDRKKFLKSLGLAAFSPWLPGLIKKSSGSVRAANTNHKILSCNIRVALDRDEAKGVGWKDRRELCFQVIKSRQPDIICLQEVIRPQMSDLEKALPDFASFGFAGPVMDTYQTGYHGIAKNPIMFSKERYELTSAGNYWLSETPMVAGSMSWGSGRARHVNWVRLREHKSRREFRVVNTHLDHVSQHARKHQARMIVAESEQYPPDFSQLLAGDFNQDASDAVIKNIKDGGWIKDGGGWSDTYAAVHGPEDPGNTVHGFKGPEAEVRKGKVDFIFARGQVIPKAAAVIKDNRDGFYPSDHYFISAEVTI